MKQALRQKAITGKMNLLWNWPLLLFTENYPSTKRELSLIFSALKKSIFLKSMCLQNFPIRWYLNILNLFNISMMLNKCIIQWFWVECYSSRWYYIEFILHVFIFTKVNIIIIFVVEAFCLDFSANIILIGSM